MCDTFDPQNLKNLGVFAAGEKERFGSERTTTSFKAGQIASRARVRTGKMNVRENIYADPSLCVLAHINAVVICAFSRIRPPPPSPRYPPLLQERISRLHTAIGECRLLEAISSQPLSDV